MRRSQTSAELTLCRCCWRPIPLIKLGLLRAHGLNYACPGIAEPPLKDPARWEQRALAAEARLAAIDALTVGPGGVIDAADLRAALGDDPC